jgi:L-ascorbate metabolism protein UlaG (beta-lactamase superfamily)
LGLDDKLQITIDKIHNLLNQEDKKIWFYKIKKSKDFSPDEKWNYQKEEVKTNFMMPFYKNGCFNNDKEGDSTFLATKEIVIFLKSIFKSSFKCDLKQLVQKDPVLAKSNDLNIQWIGHSSFLIQVNGLNILSDPVFEGFHPIFKGKVKCFKRYIKPGVSLKKLPKIDVILISHNHLDHMEEKSLLYLKRYQPLVLVPYGVKKYFDDRGFKNVKEHMWWDNTLVVFENKKVKLHSVPARHNSMTRGGVKKNQSLWCGWVIEAKNKRVYFAGDTAFNEKMFSQIQKRFRGIDIALLPIAPNEMLLRHMDYKQALLALNILKAKIMIPMHWGAYRTGDEKIEDPYLEMQEVKSGNLEFNKKIKILKIGQRYQPK